MGAVSKNRHGFAQVVIAQVTATILGTIFWLLLAVLIHPIAYGHLSWLISIAMILSTLCTFGLGKTMVTYHPKEKNSKLLGGSAVIVLALSLIVGAGTSLVLDPWVGLLIVGLSLFSITTYAELAKRQYKHYMWTWIGVRTISLFLPIWIYCSWGLVAGILAGLAASYLLFGLKGLKHLCFDVSLREVWKKIKFTVSTWGADVGKVAINFLDKVLIGVLFGMAILGTYQFAYRIFLLFAVLPQILFFYLLPEKSAGEKTNRIETCGILASLVLAGAASLFALLVVPPLFPNFVDGIQSIQIMGLAIIPATIAGIKTADLYAQEKAHVVLGSHLFALGVGIVSITSLGKAFGLLGLASSVLALQVALAAGLIFFPKFRGEAGRIAASLAGVALITALMLSSTSVQSSQITVNGDRVKLTGVAMDTTVSITVIENDTEKATTAVKDAFNEIIRIEGLMSPEEESSEIYVLNHSGTSWVNLSPETIYVLKKSLYYSEISGGCFDPTVKPLVDMWMKKVKTQGKIPDPTDLSDELELVGWENLVIDEENGWARFLKEGMQVTLGGIAKGYAIDRACEVLEKSGVKQALVDVGGDIRTIGAKSWTVAIQHPRQESEWLGIIELENEAVATSGDYRRFFFLGSTRIHHIINPKTGYPAEACMSVTVVTENCIDADALSTTVFVMGPDDGKELLDFLGIKGLIVTSDGQTITSNSWGFSLNGS